MSEVVKENIVARIMREVLFAEVEPEQVGRTATAEELIELCKHIHTLETENNTLEQQLKDAERCINSVRGDIRHYDRYFSRTPN